MKLSSPAFQNNNNIPSTYTCDGKNISPPLEISDIPKGAKSMVLICDDPDAPAGTWTHWTVWNVKPEIDNFNENSIPVDSVEGITSAGDSGYHGPCPPSGTHRYIFKVFALDTMLDLNTDSNTIALNEAIKNHIIDQCQLIGLYRKQAEENNV